MPILYFLTHPDVVIDPDVPVTRWPLSERGRARMIACASQPWVATLGAVYSSGEQKAIDGAEILAGAADLTPVILRELGEIDRSSTGYVPHDRHEALAECLFKYPTESADGWETAVDAQARIVAAVETVIERSSHLGDIVIVSHGAVAGLYLGHLKDEPISRALDQPPTQGGNYYAFDVESRKVVQDWVTVTT